MPCNFECAQTRMKQNDREGSTVVFKAEATDVEEAAVQTPVVMGWGRDWLPEVPRPGVNLVAETNARGNVDLIEEKDGRQEKKRKGH